MSVTFPDVPNVPGVPPVDRQPGAATQQTQPKLSGDSLTVSAKSSTQWGIFTQGGTQALKPDSISSVGYAASYRIADYPLQDGKFESYDKVEMPFTARVVMTKGGKVDDRRNFLSALEKIRGDTKLYSVVTPERTYANVNIQDISIERSREQGANLLTVQIELVEVRVKATASFTQTRDPASADTQNNGSVQPQPVNGSPNSAAPPPASVGTVR